MSIYYKDTTRFSTNQLRRKGLLDKESILLAGYLKLGMVTPSFDPYTEHLIDAGILDGNIDWVVTPLPTELLAIKQEELIEKTIDDIKLSGRGTSDSYFESSALGVPYKYDIDKIDDKVNIMGAMLSGVSLELTCTNSEGLKIPRLHSTAEITQVFTDGLTWIQDNKTRAWDYIQAVRAAGVINDVADIRSVKWEELDERDRPAGRPINVGRP